MSWVNQITWHCNHKVARNIQNDKQDTEEFLMAANWENGVWALGLSIEAEALDHSWFVYGLERKKTKHKSKEVQRI